MDVYKWDYNWDINGLQLGYNWYIYLGCMYTYIYIIYIYIYIYCNIAKAWVHPGSPVDVSVPNQGIYMTSGRKVGAITMEGESYQLISGPALPSRAPSCGCLWVNRIISFWVSA